MILKQNIDQFLIERRNTNRRKFVKYSFVESFLIFLPCKKFKKNTLIEKEILISKAEEKINEYFDICNYAAFFEKIEKLKYILLNEYQALSLDFICQRNSIDLFKENYREKIIETVKYFKENLKNSTCNDIDKKLLKEINIDFMDLINFENSHKK